MAGAQAMRGVVLFGHGSRDPLWRQPMETVAARMTTMAPEVPVRCAYLELNQPDLPGAAAELMGVGVTRLTIVPMFLGAGRHARNDLSALVEALQQAHPQLQVTLKPALGEEPRVLELIAALALE